MKSSVGSVRAPQLTFTVLKNEHISYLEIQPCLGRRIGSVELSLACRYAVTHISSYEYDHQTAVTGTSASDEKAISTLADSFPL